MQQNQEICDFSELKQNSTEVWQGLQQTVIDKAVK